MHQGQRRPFVKAGERPLMAAQANLHKTCTNRKIACLRTQDSHEPVQALTA